MDSLGLAGMDSQAMRNCIEELTREAELRITEQQKKIEEYEAVLAQLKPLMENRTHEIVVPLGSVGFMPAKLVNTDCVTVDFGDGYFVERSVQQSVELINRRIKFLKDNLKEFQAEKKQIEERLQLVEQLLNTDNPPEIREPYDEEEERRKKKTQRKPEKKVVSEEDYQAVMDRLTELELLEEEEQKAEAAENQKSSEKKESEIQAEDEAPDGMKTVTVDDIEYNIPRGVPLDDFVTLLDHLNALEEHEDEEEEEDEDETSDGEKYSDHDSDDKNSLDSDDYPHPENSKKKQDEESSERKRSVRFNLDDQPQSSNGEPPEPTVTAKPILRNKDYQSPIDYKAIERSNERDVKKIIPSSQEAFPGTVVEHTVKDDEPQPSSTPSADAPPVRMSKFKMQRMNR